MINHKELAICKQRGHDPEGHFEKWERCKYCGMWTRTVSTMQQREDDPPENEQDLRYGLQRQMKKLNQAFKRPSERPSEISGKAGRGRGKKAK